MALSNAQKQARWRAHNVLVLTSSAATIAEMLIEMPDQAKLRSIARKISAHLARNRKLTRKEKHNAANFRTNKRGWRELWLGCGRTSKEFAQLWGSEEMKAWQQAINEAGDRAVKLAWERDHPDQEWPKHMRGLDTGDTRYHRWRERWVRSREFADLCANPRKLLALAAHAREPR